MAAGLVPVRRERRKPLARYHLKAGRCFEGERALALLPVLARVDAVSEKAASVVAFRARCFKRDLGIDTERKALFLFPEPVLEAPPLAAARSDLEIKAAGVEEARAWRLPWPCGRRSRSTAFWG